MTFRYITYAASVLFGLNGLATPYATIEDTVETDICERSKMIVKTARKFHYAPRPIDDQFAAFVFEDLLDRLDPKAFYFTKKDFEYLQSNHASIQNELLEGQCSFLGRAVDTYDRAQHRVDSLLTLMEKATLDFSKQDSITFTKDQIWLSQAELASRWKSRIKLRVLHAYYDDVDSLYDVDVHPDTMEVIKMQVIDKLRCTLKSERQREGGLEEKVGVRYLKSIATAFDPHTAYFLPFEKEGFETMLSKETESFGFSIINNDRGEIEISGLLPGGPAWNSGKINEGDIILHIQTVYGDFEITDCISLNEVDEFLNEKISERAYFTIKKKSGKEIEVLLVKKRVEVSDNIIQTFILDGEDKKLGYIYLPSFYTDYSQGGEMANGCANDFATELIKLKRKDIDGLILDLRDNGGGSMLEAIRMVGIFINFGAISVYQATEQEPITLKDLSRGTIYNDPVLVLQNSFSASASELFAAAMQDHHRAVIVGTPSFGKATAQNVVPIDAYQYDSISDVLDNNDESEYGFLKLTVGAFYRVTGETHQGQGIKPDVHLPYIYEALGISEASLFSSIMPGHIDKKTYYTALDSIPSWSLNRSSLNRINREGVFTEIASKSEELADWYNLHTIPVSQEGYVEYYFGDDQEDQDTSEFSNDDFKVLNPEYIRGVSSMNESENEINENIMNEIAIDPYIQESYRILKELINYSN